MNTSPIMRIITMNMDVKKFYVFLAFCGLFSTGIAQTGVKNTFTFEGGAGLNAYSIQTSQGFEEAIGASWNFNAMGGYYFHDRVNVNMEYQFHRYFTANDSSRVNRANYISSNRIGVGIRFAIVDNGRYQLSVGGTVGLFDFVAGFEDSLSTVVLYANGIYQNYGFTNNFYFGEKKQLGLFVKLGIVNNPMTIKDIVVNDESRESYQEIEVNKYKFNSIGYYLNLGVAFNLGLSEKRRVDFE